MIPERCHARGCLLLHATAAGAAALPGPALPFRALGVFAGRGSAGATQLRSRSSVHRLLPHNPLSLPRRMDQVITLSLVLPDEREYRKILEWLRALMILIDSLGTYKFAPGETEMDR